MAIVTISRLEACRGEEVAAAVARRLGFRLVDRPLMRELLYSYDLLSAIGRLNAPAAADADAPGAEERALRAATEGIIWHLAFRENIVLLGHGGQFLFGSCPGALHVRLLPSLEYRLATAREQGTGLAVAALLRRERERRRIVRRFCGADITRSEHYDCVLRVDTFGVEVKPLSFVNAHGAGNYPFGDPCRDCQPSPVVEYNNFITIADAARTSINGIYPHPVRIDLIQPINVL